MGEPITLAAATVTLLTAAITASGEIIGAYISKREVEIDTAPLVSKNEYYESILKIKTDNSE